MGEERAYLNYQVKKNDAEGNFLELKFCVTGNMYCKEVAGKCHKCKEQQTAVCKEKFETIDLVSFKFNRKMLKQYVKTQSENQTISEQVLSFQYKTSFSRTLPLCSRTRAIVEGLLNHEFSGNLENIFINAQTQLLLLYSLNCMDDKELDVINCKFLSNLADREKVAKAREILLDQIGEPITIKQLSRRVAMNECYLKKGFKEMYGTTIFEFYQNQRMEHAKYLLYEKGLSVTDVSGILGYSSISHFSTAFKKHTGLKPCELLFR